MSEDEDGQMLCLFALSFLPQHLSSPFSSTSHLSQPHNVPIIDDKDVFKQQASVMPQDEDKLACGMSKDEDGQN